MDVAGILTGFLGFGTLIIVLLILITIISLSVWAYLRWKKYQQYKTIIWERDAFGNIRQYEDNAGVFVDKKTNNKRLFLQKTNVGLEPDNIPYVVLANGKKQIYLIRRGLKNFQYIKPIINEKDFVFSVTEEDVNWSINAYERQKKIFQSSSLLQYLPFILLAFVSIIILIMFIYFFKDFGVLKEVALALQNTAEALRTANTGGVVLS